MYGMTEVGVIATDLFGVHRPAVLSLPRPHCPRRSRGTARLAAGITVPRRPGPEPLVGRLAAHQGPGSVDPATTRAVLGRRDSQAPVGGLKVDLTEVEHTLAALNLRSPGSLWCTTTVDRGVLVLAEGAEVSAVEREITTRLAAYKRPRRLYVVERLPRTATGLVRDQPGRRRRRAGVRSPPKTRLTLTARLRASHTLIGRTPVPRPMRSASSCSTR